jgi:hypothetical protein
MNPLDVAAEVRAAAGTGDAGGGRRRGVSKSSAGAAVRTRRQGKATGKAARPNPPSPRVRPPVQYRRGGGFGAGGYPRIDLEQSATRAKFRSIDASIRELDEDVALVGLEVAEIRAGMKREASEREDRMNELEREVNAAVAASATLPLPERLALASEMRRKAKEWEVTSQARLAVWQERSDACTRMNEAVDRKRQRILLTLEKARYHHNAALRRPPAQGGRADMMAAARRGGPPYDDDDDSD